MFTNGDNMHDNKRFWPRTRRRVSRRNVLDADARALIAAITQR